MKINKKKSYNIFGLILINIVFLTVIVYAGISYTIGTGTLTGTVYDNSTKLRWTRCAINNSDNPDITSNCTENHKKATWEQALTICYSLDFSGTNDWRLPNIREIQSIVDYSEIVSPVVEKSIFPNTHDGKYWSSTTFHDKLSSYVWTLDFQYGSVGLDDKSANNYYVRCVTGP